MKSVELRPDRGWTCGQGRIECIQGFGGETRRK